MRQIGSIRYDFEKCTFGGGGLCVSAPEIALFALSLRAEDGTQTKLNGQNAAFEGLDERGGTLTAHYSFECGVHVRLHIACSGERTAFRLDADVPADRKLEWAEYAPVCVPPLLERDGEGGRGKILWPYNEGALLSRLRDRESDFLRYREPEYPSLGSDGIYPNMVESQFLAYLAGGEGIYLGAHDSQCGTKSIDFEQRKNCIYLRIRAYADTGFGENYAAAYDTVIQAFKGDWMDAADIYAEWFAEGTGAAFKKSHENPDLPAWYKNPPVVVAYPVRGHHDTDEMSPNKLFPYTNALPVLRGIAEKTGGSVMALLMHWEGTAPWAPPYVWPPYGGEENFRAFAEQLHAEGNLLGVYCSGLGWTQKSNLVDYSREEQFEKENLQKIMCTAPDGSLPLSNICTAQRSGYDMCPACEETGRLVRGQAEKIAAAGVDYIQILDQNHGGNCYFCYSKEHGHNPGPGKWQARAMRRLLAPLTGKNKPLLGCESAAADCFLDMLRFSDNRFELVMFIGENVPLYSYLYHEYLYNFMGNQVCMPLQPSPVNYLYRVAYSFAAGDAPTLVINDSGEIAQHWGQRDFSVMPDRDAALRLIAGANAWRRGFAAKYLCTGKMLRPNRVDCESIRIPIYPGLDDLVVPRVLTSRWRAADGTSAQVLINHTLQDCAVSCAPGRLRKNPAAPEDCERTDGNFVVPALSTLLWEAD